MAYAATVIPVMIASPGDVLTERNLAREVINDWNSIHSLTAKTVLIPTGWDTHASPDLAGRPQKLINERVLKDCDLLVGVFWTRLGTPTGGSESGTVEEIKTHIAEGKPAMVYFSDAPVAPAALDADQYEALKKFRDWCKQQGLISTYDNTSDFRSKFARELQIQMNGNEYLKNVRKAADASAQRELQTSGLLNLGLERVRSPELSQEARNLLLEASLDEHGYILKSEHLGGASIQTNRKTFGESDHRTYSKWTRAIDQLQRSRLIDQKDPKGQVFQITADGYEIAEKLKL
jgi:hypothetical protein